MIKCIAVCNVVPCETQHEYHGPVLEIENGNEIAHFDPSTATATIAAMAIEAASTETTSNNANAAKRKIITILINFLLF